MADIDVGSHAGMGALVDEARHFADAVEQAHAEGLKFERNIQVFAVGVVAQLAAGLDRPPPLVRGRDHFALPQILAQDH